MTAVVAVAMLVAGQLAVADPARLPPVELRAEVWVPEDWPLESLVAAARLPRTTLAVQTRSNMLRPEVAQLLARKPGAWVRLRPGLVPAHQDQLRKLPRAGFVIRLPERPDAELEGRLATLGPQRVRFEVARLGEEQARWLARQKNVEVELDLRGRLPEQDELRLFAGLTRAQRAIRLGVADPPAVVAGAGWARPHRWILVAPDGVVPEPMREALSASGVQVRVAVDETKATAEVLRPLVLLPGMSLEIRLGTNPASALRQVEALLEGRALERR